MKRIISFLFDADSVDVDLKQKLSQVYDTEYIDEMFVRIQKYVQDANKLLNFLEKDISGVYIKVWKFIFGYLYSYLYS